MGFVARQLDVAASLAGYGERSQTQSDHLGAVMDHLGFRHLGELDGKRLGEWLVDRALGTVGEGVHRVREAGEYVYRRGIERASNPIQAGFDGVTGTALVSDVAGLTATLVAGGEVTPVNCPDFAVCVGEVDFTPKAAHAVGKTVIHDLPVLTEEQMRHEGDHVKLVDELGGILFGGWYVVESVRQVLRGNEWDDDNWFEVRAEKAEIAPQPTLLPRWWLPWQWLDGGSPWGWFGPRLVDRAVSSTPTSTGSRPSNDQRLP